MLIDELLGFGNIGSAINLFHIFFGQKGRNNFPLRI